MAARPTVAVVGRKLDVDKLVGATEIASRLGVARPQVIYSWRRRHPDFPGPALELSIGLVWYWPEVERWAKATGRLVGAMSERDRAG